MGNSDAAALLLIRIPLVEDALYDEHSTRCLWCYQPLDGKYGRKRHIDCQQMYRAMRARCGKGKKMQTTQQKAIRDRHTMDPMRPCEWCHKPLNIEHGHKKMHFECARAKDLKRQRDRYAQTHPNMRKPGEVRPKRVRNRAKMDPMRPCLRCHRPLNTDRSHAKYHPACLQERERERKQERNRDYVRMRALYPERSRKSTQDPMRPCAWCGEPLNTENPYSLYHPTCFTFHRKHRTMLPPVLEKQQELEQKQQRLARDPLRPCEWCHQPLRDDNPNRRYHPSCFEEHRKVRMKELQGPPKDPMRLCIECGKPLNDASPIRKRHPMCAEKYEHKYRVQYARLVRHGKLFPRKHKSHKEHEAVQA